MWIRAMVAGAAGLLVALVVPSATADDPPSPSPTAANASGGGDSSGAPRAKTPIVISNENLADYAGRGRVTSVAGGGSRGSSSARPLPDIAWEGEASATGGLAGGGTASDSDDQERRRYWRGEYQKQLELVSSLEEQIEVLDREIPGLWRDYYARDDPMYRDGVIKPKLDQALVKRQQLEERWNKEQERIPRILDQARRDGAEPGWFRGLERPTPVRHDSGSVDEPVKPTDFHVDVVSADDT